MKNIISYVVACFILVVGIATVVIYCYTDWIERLNDAIPINMRISHDDPHDKTHYAQIVDCVKMFISEQQLIAEFPKEEDNIEKLSDKLHAKWKHSNKTFRDLLKIEKKDIANRWLEKYNGFKPNFTEFSHIEGKKWKVFEKQTGVSFIITITQGNLYIVSYDLWEYQERIREQNERQVRIIYLQEFGEETLTDYRHNIGELVNNESDLIKYACQIEDYVRITLAFKHPSLDNVDSKFVSKMYDLCSENERKDIYPAHKVALAKLLTTGNSSERKLAKTLLDIYNSLYIDLSPFVKSKKSSDIWYFKELHSNVRFSFDSDIEMCVENDDDLFAYGDWLDYCFEQKNKNTTNSYTYNSTSNDAAFVYFKYIMGDDFTQKDITYLENKYSPLIPMESRLYEAELICDEDRTEIMPTQDVIINLLMHHYNIPLYVGEYFAKATERHFYINANHFCYAYELCKKLIDEDRFIEFYQNLRIKKSYCFTLVNFEKIKHLQSKQDLKMCEVLDEFLSCENGNGGVSGFSLFADYFDFIEYDPYSGMCTFTEK